MTDDLVKRLRRYGEWIKEDREPTLFHLVTDEAADRIEQLEKQNGKLKSMFRIHMLRLMPNLTHEDIDNHIEEALEDE